MSIYGVIYLFTNNTNGKRYVGQTTSSNPQKYCDGHFINARRGSTKVFHEAIREFGQNAFTSEIIWYAFDRSSLDMAEDFFITSFNTLNPGGYNMKRGGSNGKHSKAAKAKMSISVRAANTPEILLKRAIATRLSNTPEVQDKRNISLRAAWDEDARLRHGEMMKDILAQPEIKEKLELAKRLAFTPEIIIKRNAAIKVACTDPKTKERKSKASKSSKNIEHLKIQRCKIIENPELLAKRNESVRTAWAQPEIRERQSQIVKEIWAKRKLARLSQ